MQKIKDKGEILKEAREERKPHQLTSKDKNHIELLLKSHANKSKVKYLVLKGKKKTTRILLCTRKIILQM